VTEFVEGNQHTQSNQGADNHVKRTHLISPHSNPVPARLKRANSLTRVAVQPLFGQDPSLAVGLEHRRKIIHRHNGLKL